MPQEKKKRVTKAAHDKNKARGEQKRARHREHAPTPSRSKNAKSAISPLMVLMFLFIVLLGITLAVISSLK